MRGIGWGAFNSPDGWLVAGLEVILIADGLFRAVGARLQKLRGVTSWKQVGV